MTDLAAIVARDAEAETRPRYVLGYSVTRDRWFVEDTTTGNRRTFKTRLAALARLAALDPAVPA